MKKIAVVFLSAILLISCTEDKPSAVVAPACDLAQYWTNYPDLQLSIGNPVDAVDDAADQVALQSHWDAHGQLEGRTCLPVSSSSSMLSSAVVAPAWVLPAGQLRRVGFAPSYVPAVETIRFAALTDIIFFNIQVNDDGSLNTAPYDAAKHFATIKAQAVANGVNMLVTLGGSGKSGNFNLVFSDPVKRVALISALLNFVTVQGLNGIDVDWEFPEDGEAPIFLTFMQELYATFQPAGLMVTLDLPTKQHAERVNFDPALVNFVDYFNVMAYDMNYGGLSYHAKLEDVQATTDYWLTSGYPASKLIVGIPFYYKNQSVAGGSISWNDYLKKFKYEQAIAIQTIKPTWAERLAKIQWIATVPFAGVMYWELGQDTYTTEAYNDSSLTQYFHDQLLLLGK